MFAFQDYNVLRHEDLCFHAVSQVSNQVLGVKSLEQVL